MTPGGHKRKLWQRPALVNSGGVVVSAGALAVVLLVNGSGEPGVLQAGRGIIDAPKVPLLTPSSPAAVPSGSDAPSAVSTGAANERGCDRRAEHCVSETLAGCTVDGHRDRGSGRRRGSSGRSNSGVRSACGSSNRHRQPEERESGCRQAGHRVRGWCGERGHGHLQCHRLERHQLRSWQWWRQHPGEPGRWEYWPGEPSRGGSGPANAIGGGSGPADAIGRGRGQANAINRGNRDGPGHGHGQAD